MDQETRLLKSKLMNLKFDLTQLQKKEEGVNLLKIFAISLL